jgi:hypothetical protein
MTNADQIIEFVVARATPCKTVITYAYLPISSARDDAPVTRDGHEQRVVHVVAVPGVERQGRRRLLPVPEHEGPVVGPGEEQPPVGAEAYRVDAAPVLP